MQRTSPLRGWGYLPQCTLKLLTQYDLCGTRALPITPDVRIDQLEMCLQSRQPHLAQQERNRAIQHQILAQVYPRLQVKLGDQHCALPPSFVHQHTLAAPAGPLHQVDQRPMPARQTLGLAHSPRHGRRRPDALENLLRIQQSRPH